MTSFFFLSLMNSDSWGGSEEIWFRSAIHLAQKGCRVGVCCYNWPGKQNKLDQLTSAGCELHLLPGRNETTSVWKKIKLKTAIRKIPIESYDEVIINQGGWKDIVHGPFKIVYKRCKKYTLIYHNYDAETLSPRKKELFIKWVRNAKTNIGDASRIFTEIAKTKAILIPNQRVLFNPITFPSPDHYTPFVHLVNDSLNFIVLAQLDLKRKAQDILIRALSTEKWRARNWKLHIYGKGNDADTLAKMIETTGLSDKVFLKGYSQDIPAVLTWSHVLLQLTHIDAMPISVTEAMAMSRAVVASDAGDMPLWIKNDVNGWIANEVSAEAIDAVLEKAWQNRHNLEAMGKESFNIFTEKYPVDPVTWFLDIAGISEIRTNEQRI
ncbi:MAG TPA: glycosyltransferase family 4 protein [Chitinophagaceae bacterium]|nr:glycosyltransferase family 4 protein [Chitinophagaceae bacterium]